MKFGIPTAAVPITDSKTGLASAPWYLYLRNILNSVWHSSDGSAGVSGTFTTVDGKTATVKDGLITKLI